MHKIYANIHLVSKLYIPNQDLFDEKIKKLKTDGVSKLHIISDFDRTLTGGLADGKIPPTSWSIFVHIFGKEYADKRQELFDHYHPIEIDNTADITYRSKEMSDWFRKHLELLVEQGVTKNIIREVLSSGDFKLRGGVDELLNLTKKYEIPFLIFSAGLGDVVTLELEKESLLYKNIKILSNFFKFDDKEKAIGFTQEIVHSFNKTEQLVHTKEYKDHITQRPNCILLGDALYDATMADGLSHSTILKVGLLNGNFAEKDEYAKVYDAILENDTDITDINSIIADIFV